MGSPYRLTTLGTVDLVDSEGRRVLSVCSQPKRLALLAYLIVEGRRGPVSRDLAASVFWPEADQERARANLRNAVHFLRRSLGPNTIDSVGEHIVIDEDQLACDAVQVLRGTASQDDPAALDEFFRGFHVRGAGAALEDWISEVQALEEGPTQEDDHREDDGKESDEEGQNAILAPSARSGVPGRTALWVATVALVVSFGAWRGLGQEAEAGVGPSGDSGEVARRLYAQALSKNIAGSSEENMAAEQLLLEAVRADPNYGGAYAFMAMVLGARSMFIGGQEEWADSAAVLAQHAVRLDSASSDARWALSFARFQQSRYREAASAALRAWERQPTHRGVLNNLGFIAIYRGNHFDAITWGLEAIEVSPGWVVPRTLVGLALMELGRTDDALAWFRSAREADPDWPPLTGFEVNALISAGRLDEVDRLIERTEDVGPDVMANVAIAKGDLLGALDYLNQRYGMAPDDMPPYGISTRARLGLVLHALGRTRDAAPFLEEAESRALREVAEGNESKNYPLEMAAIEASRGNLDEAMRWLTEAESKGWRDDSLSLIRPGLAPLEDDPRFEAALERIREAHETTRQRLYREGLPGPLPPVPARSATGG